MKRFAIVLLALLLASSADAGKFYQKASKSALDDIAGLSDGDRGMVVDSSGVTTTYYRTGGAWVVTSLMGGVVILTDVTGPTAAQSWGSMNVMTGNGTVTLPTAVAGMSMCVMDSGTAHDIIVDVQGGDTMTLKGTEGSAGVGITNAAGSTTGDFVCVVSPVANKWSTLGMGGTWASQ